MEYLAPTGFIHPINNRFIPVNNICSTKSLDNTDLFKSLRTLTYKYIYTFGGYRFFNLPLLLIN